MFLVVVTLMLVGIGLAVPKASADTVRPIIFPVIGPGKFSNDFNASRPAPWYKHNAIDIIANKGQLIVSPIDGVIKFVAYPEPSYGYDVEVKDDEGYEYHLLHINNDNPGTNDNKGGAMHAYGPDIKEGNRIARGQFIGYVGDSGHANGIPHLHFEMYAPDGTVLNPYQSLVPAQRVAKPVVYPQLANENLPYGPNFTGNATLDLGNYDADANTEFITGAGVGGGPHVKIFDNDSSFTGRHFMAYDPNFTGGIDVASGDINGDGTDEIITGPGAGGGPNVKVYTNNGILVSSFFAYDPNFKGGIRVTSADIDGDGADEIITGPSAGGGPNVKVFEANGTQISSFFAYNPGFTGGIDVGAGNVFGTSRAEIVTAAGPGGGPHIRVFETLTNSPISSFFAYNEGYQGGVRVSVGNVKTGTPEEEIVTVPASPPGGPNIRMLNYQGNEISAGNFMEVWWEGYSDVGAGKGASLATTGINRRASIRAGLY